MLSSHGRTYRASTFLFKSTRDRPSSADRVACAHCSQPCCVSKILHARMKGSTYVYPGSQSKRLFWLAHTGSTVQGIDLQMRFCQMEMKVNERFGERDCGRSFQPHRPRFDDRSSECVGEMFDVDGYWLHGCIAAYDNPTPVKNFAFHSRGSARELLDCNPTFSAVHACPIIFHSRIARQIKHPVGAHKSPTLGVQHRNSEGTSLPKANNLTGLCSYCADFTSVIAVSADKG